MKGFLLSQLFEMMLPIVVGIITPYCVDGLKLVNSWLDKAPAVVKQAMAVVIAGLITGITNIVGHGLPTDLAQWDTAAVQSVVAALLGIAIKQQKQKKRLEDTLKMMPANASPISGDPDSIARVRS